MILSESLRCSSWSTHLHAKRLRLQFAQVVRVVLQLPPQVGVLLAENLHLQGQMVIGNHSVGHVHPLQRPLQDNSNMAGLHMQNKSFRQTANHWPFAKLHSEQLTVMFSVFII